MFSFTKVGNWFVTKSGQTFMFRTALAVGGCIGALKMFPDTFFLDKYMDIVRLHKSGFTVPVSSSLKSRFEKTLNLLEVPEFHRPQFRPFMVIGFDIFSAGTFSSRYGVIVGLPINFTYCDSSNPDLSTIRVNGKSVPWDSAEGELLKKSMNLSEKAQFYAIAREIMMKKSELYYIDLFTAIGTFVAAYGIATGLNISKNLFNKPRSIRILMYSLVGAFTYCNYIFIKDFAQLYYERKVDDYLKNKNLVFKEGGKEFYEKIIKRNIALRKLMGSEGESKYSILGNENCIVRQRHLPLIQRRDFFDDVEYN